MTVVTGLSKSTATEFITVIKQPDSNLFKAQQACLHCYIRSAKYVYGNSIGSLEVYSSR